MQEKVIKRIILKVDPSPSNQLKIKATEQHMKVATYKRRQIQQALKNN